MGGEDKEAGDIFLQIQSLVSDRLQVISYKWLSRNFSVSSNNAKRLLNEFVEKHGNDLEVLYAISGWSKDNPTSYSVKLTSAPKLEETRKEFEEISSVQVYSIQVKIPTDTSVLWNSEFVQAEELFKQPSFQDNCLRDNRFCGIFNSFVERTSDLTKPINRSPIKPKSDAFQKDIQSLKPLIKKEQPSKSENKTESSKNTSPAGDQKVNNNNSKPLIKEGVKIKGQNGKEKSNNGSIASMFGRVSTKPKSVKNELEDSPSIAGSADAQICAKEEENMISSDEEQEMNFKSNNSGSSRKRRVIFDFSDEENENEEEGDVISLASPEPPKKPEILVIEEEKELESKKEEKLMGNKKEEKKLENKKGEKKLENEKEEKKLENKKEKKLENKKEEPVKSNSAEKGKEPKRRKVLKKRIDERGREVSEFVWEGEEAPSDKMDQDNNTNKDTTNRLPTNKTPTINTDRSNTTNNKTPSNASGTGSNKPAANKKPAKAGAKDVKQGNIMSFFKKI